MCMRCVWVTLYCFDCITISVYFNRFLIDLSMLAGLLNHSLRIVRLFLWLFFMARSIGRFFISQKRTKIKNNFIVLFVFRSRIICRISLHHYCIKYVSCVFLFIYLFLFSNWIITYALRCVATKSHLAHTNRNDDSSYNFYRNSSQSIRCRVFCLRPLCTNRWQVHLLCSAVAIRVNQYHWRTAWPYTSKSDDSARRWFILKCVVVGCCWFFFLLPYPNTHSAFRRCHDKDRVKNERCNFNCKQLKCTTLIEVKENVYTFHIEFMFCCCHCTTTVAATRSNKSIDKVENVSKTLHGEENNAHTVLATWILLMRTIFFLLLRRYDFFFQ